MFKQGHLALLYIVLFYLFLLVVFGLFFGFFLRPVTEVLTGYSGIKAYLISSCICSMTIAYVDHMSENPRNNRSKV